MTDKTFVAPEERHRMIAETAYFLAQERGFVAGDPVSDWIEAERKVDRELCALATARMVERLEHGVARAAKTLGVLKRRVSTLAASTRSELNADVEKLDGLKQTLRSKLEEFRERGDQVTEKALAQAEKVWTELSDALQRVTSRTQHS
jgi:predicted RNase H-like nuclease (RuvC/YqgF family)